MAKNNKSNSKEIYFDASKSDVLSRIDHFYDNIFTQTYKKLIDKDRTNKNLIIYDFVVLRQIWQIDYVEIALLIEKTYQEYSCDSNCKFIKDKDGNICAVPYYKRIHKDYPHLVVSAADICKNILPYLYYLTNAKLAIPEDKFNVDELLPTSLDYMQVTVDFLIDAMNEKSPINELGYFKVGELIEKIPQNTLKYLLIYVKSLIQELGDIRMPDDVRKVLDHYHDKEYYKLLSDIATYISKYLPDNVYGTSRKRN